jgi:hypothetical protein
MTKLQKYISTTILTKCLRLLQYDANKGITSESIADRLGYLDVSAVATQVVKGKLSEAAAIDSLFRSLQATQNRDSDDRYINFYG